MFFPNGLAPFFFRGSLWISDKTMLLKTAQRFCETCGVSGRDGSKNIAISGGREFENKQVDVNHKPSKNARTRQTVGAGYMFDAAITLPP